MSLAGAGGGAGEEGATATAPDGVTRRRRNGLLLQIAVLLTVAIVPVGLVAVVQTQRTIESTRKIYLDSLRAKTMEAATPEREGIMRALGVARGLSDAVAVLDPDDATCRQLMQRSAATNTGILFVGLIEPPGTSTCNNLAAAFDFTANAASGALFADPRGDVRFNPAGDISGDPVVILSEPVYAPDGAFRGFISISYPASRLHEGDLVRPEGTPAVVLFNARGEILSTTAPDRLAAVVPAGQPLADLAGQGRAEFWRRARAAKSATTPSCPSRRGAPTRWAAGSRRRIEAERAGGYSPPWPSPSSCGRSASRSRSWRCTSS